MTYQILIAISDRDERALCERLLGVAESIFQPRAVASALDYAPLLSEETIDAVIMSLDPGFCGAIDLLRTLRTRSIPAIMLYSEHERGLLDAIHTGGAVHRVERSAGGYLALPRILTETLEGTTDIDQAGMIPESLIHSLGGLVFILDDAGRIIRASGPLTSKVQVQGLPLVIAERRKRSGRARAGRAPQSWDNVTVQATDGSSISGHITVAATSGAHGEPQTVGIFLAVPEHLATKTSDLAPRLFQITHDLKAPLRGVARTLDLLRAGGSTISAQDRSLLDGAHAGVTDAIDALRHALKPPPSQPDIVEQESGLTDAATMMEEVRLLLTPDIEERKATLRIGKLPQLPVEANDLRIILTNLLDNALKYCTAATPVITVQATRRGSAWLFSMHDNGPGIPNHELEKIFEMHRRGTNAQGRGNGVGLALCREAVERYGGSIWVTTGAGSTFQFTLPAIGLVTDRVQVKAG